MRPLHVAAATCGPNAAAMCELLLEQGRANPDVADAHKNRPLHKAVEGFLLAGHAKDKATGALVSPEDCARKNGYVLDVVKVRAPVARLLCAFFGGGGLFGRSSGDDDGGGHRARFALSGPA